jgi:tetratricopeptide (TPR) repeat protein
MTYCKSADLALATGQEAIAMIHTLGRTSRLADAYAIMSSAYMGLGQIDKGIETARKALDAAQSKHPPHAPPDSGTLNAAANLVTKQVGFAHSADALAITRPLIQRALADLAATDRDGLVSVLMHQAQAYENLGQGQAALESIERAMALMGTFEADASQRVMVLDRYADILGGQGKKVLAARAFQEAAKLHSDLHHDGTGQANEHVARQVRFALRNGHPEHAEQALASFWVKPSATGAVTKPQLEHRLMTAEIALARGDWPAALTASRQVQERQALYPLPQYVRDLSARALLVQGTALKALGRSGEARTSLQAARDLQLTLLRPTE